MRPTWASAIALAALLLSHSAVASPSCGDFLQSVARKPLNLEFLGCESGHHHQLRALIATYRVKGEHASDVESHLVRHTKMAKLSFVCCGWEPSPRGPSRFGTLPGQLGFGHQVEMGSEETLVNLRRNWKQIPWFYVTVTVLLEEP